MQYSFLSLLIFHYPLYSIHLMFNHFNFRINVRHFLFIIKPRPMNILNVMLFHFYNILKIIILN